MSRPHDAQRPFFPFSNPFRMIRPKGYLSPKLFALLNSFEETLAERLKKLKAKKKSDVFSFSWMRSLMESVSETHEHVKSLVTDLQFPISDWDEKWMDMYLDNSIRLLDMCIVFSSELSRLNQGQLLIQHAAHVLDCSKDFPSTEQLAQGRASLHDWMERICSRNPKLESSQDIFQELTRSLSMPKLKSSAKGKVLIRAMYSVKVVTVFACSIFMAAFSGSAKMLMNLHVPEEFLWSAPFNELLQTCTSDENKALFTCGSVTVLKELLSVHGCVEKLYAATEGTPREERESLQKTVLALGESAEAFSQEIDLLTDQVDGFFQIVLTGRDALLCNLRLSDRNRGNNAVEQAVR